MKDKCFLVLVLSVFLTGIAFADDPFIGEYEGQICDSPVKACVVAREGSRYDITIFSLDNSLVPGGIELTSAVFGGNLYIMGTSAGRNWTGSIVKGKMKLTANYYSINGELEKIERESPTLGLQPPKDAIVLLPYQPGKKSSLEKWTNKDWTLLDDGSVQVKPGKGTNTTLKEFSSVKLHLEFNLPLEPHNAGQKRANSGVFFNKGSYEVQILDSFGLIPSNGDCGSIYSIKPPMVNASLPPQRWQTYDITFIAPETDKDGKITKKPRITVLHNGILIHDDVEIPRSTINPDFEQKTAGPISLQDHSNPVKFRNIWAVELD
ncbi:hypothetical protein SMSP2_01911 [Limihaloglobus sulfuriphilus]|uniref:3-keto-alpha-glucoside-1,2-lyase/3-keto-2-hydroxy-glucal hydratase domain-containing protein n=1 Tax=Limihaloglobus sulfuriphilus TaxID=1851148 RepID=A0A1Q2MGU9_9BACT|nr:DUF1080 domain-containing protein [Limihaloglobus sulfuriphilus]AQQ71537.1 hypothetical protein SMSP2_01911 [Limihaloglobus sulfuriphilus]